MMARWFVGPRFAAEPDWHSSGPSRMRAGGHFLRACRFLFLVGA